MYPPPLPFLLCVSRNCLGRFLPHDIQAGFVIYHPVNGLDRLNGACETSSRVRCVIWLDKVYCLPASVSLKHGGYTRSSCLWTHSVILTIWPCILMRCLRSGPFPLGSRVRFCFRRRILNQMHEGHENGKGDLPGPCFLLQRFGFRRRWPLSWSSLRIVVPLAGQRVEHAGVGRMSPPPRLCAYSDVAS